MKKLFFIFLTVFTIISCSEDEPASSFGPISFTEITSNSITINWEHKLDKLQEYQVYRTENKEDKLIATIKDINTKSYKDTNLTPDTSYNYYVKAIIDDNNFIKVNGTAKTSK